MLDVAFIGIIVYFLWNTSASSLTRIAILLVALAIVSAKFVWADWRVAAVVAQGVVSVGLAFWLTCEARWSNRHWQKKREE
jgi:hypothetical protein